MKRIIIIIVMVVFAFALAGCTAKYQIKNLAGTQGTTNLNSTGGVYLALPGDGAYQSKTYPGSGQTVVSDLAAAFSQYAAHVTTGSTAFDQADAIKAASKHGDKYAVVPVITHWEPRNTTWSGKRSRMALRITIIDVATQQQLSSVAVEGKSAQQTFAETSPEKLLSKPIEKYVAGLYQ